MSRFKADLQKSDCRLDVKSASLNCTEKIVCDYRLCCLPVLFSMVVLCLNCANKVL